MTTPDPLLARGPAEREFLMLFRKLDRQQQRDTLADMIRRPSPIVETGADA